MKMKKLLALLLAGLLSCSLLIACGTDSDSDWDDDDEEAEDRDDRNENGDSDIIIDGDTTTTPTTSTPDTPTHTHSWSEWDVITTPTCFEEGVATRSCPCGETETNQLAKLEHTEGDWIIIQKPTATTDGERGLACSVCGDYIKREPYFELDAEWTYSTDDLGYCKGYGQVNGVYKDVILDSFGEIVYAVADNEKIEIYANGYFISKQDNVQYLKKADGTIVCSTESLEVNGFGLTENTEDYTQFLHDGYVFVYKFIDTFADSITQVGILGTDGNWIVPLSEDNPIITTDIPYFEKFYTAHWHFYVGDGILVLKNYDAPYDAVLYNIKDNEIYELTSSGTLAYNTDYLLTTATFKDGVAYVSSHSYVYKFYSNGKIERSDLETEFHDFCVDEFGNYYTITDSTICLNGITHVELGFTVADAVWTGDYWLTLIKNPSGIRYYTYMTLYGDFLFDPVQTEAVYICDLRGFTVGELYADGTKLVIDQTNTVYYTSTNPKAEIYLNKGIVCEQLKGAFSSNETYTILDLQ